MITDEQKQYILERYKTKDAKTIVKELNLSRSQVTNFLYKNGIAKRDKWTKAEDDYILNNHKKYSYSQIARELHKTESAVQQRASKVLAIKKDSPQKWTQEEIEYLKKHIESDSYESIKKHLRGRSYSSIYNKVWELGLIPDNVKNYKKVKKDQILFIIANCDTMTDTELGNKFGISAEAVSEIRKKHGIKKTFSSSHRITYIEDFVKKQLDDNEIDYKFNQKLGNFIPDFQLDNNIIIEVNGDYFHCNPELYPDGPKDEIQIKHVLRDYYKKCFYVSNKYNVYYFWENDIIKNPEKIIKQIKEIKSALCEQKFMKLTND